ncbi:LysR family transcriptional regulator substrate-binding protein [Salibacterium aidingense]|uniref:LysR family transcriptional regulator substrate-binding protein n=1 Tax=Salibacterium aidingense TaxID=384933 RepID=UPI00047AED81|nr:LysR family transcriptional regulator substrate-binding protein [Salibacterium aidingense]
MCKADSPLAEKQSIEPSDLSDQHIVEYSGINSKRIVRKFFKDHNTSMNSLFESNQFEIIKRTISEGIAISFINGLLLRNEPRVLNGKIVPLPLKNFDDLEISYGWLRMKNTYFSPVAKEFLKYLKKQIEVGDY